MPQAESYAASAYYLCGVCRRAFFVMLHVAVNPILFYIFAPQETFRIDAVVLSNRNFSRRDDLCTN